MAPSRQNSRSQQKSQQTPYYSSYSAAGPSSRPLYDEASSSHQPRLPDNDSLSSLLDTMPQYTSRDVGDPSQMKKTKQSMADLKLRRLTELNSRLREDLDRDRIPVSQASKR